MSDYIPNEYKIPQGIHHPDNQMIIKDELNNIYEEEINITAKVPIEEQKKSENSHYDILFNIADNISRSRTLYIERNNQSESTKKIIKGLSARIFGSDTQTFTPENISIEQLMKIESEIGSELFEKKYPNEVIHFFNEDHHNWYFYQEIKTAFNNSKSITLHYEIHENGILRISDVASRNCEYIDGDEFDNFMLATKMYHDRVMERLYSFQNQSKKAA